MLKLEVFLELEQVKEVFEEMDVKYSAKKKKRVIEMIEESDPDVKERLEDALKEVIGELISDEWEE